MRLNKESLMRLLNSLLQHLPTTTVYAHCDLPCGVYDPAQARIEAASIYGICKKYQDNQDADFRARALILKEERAELVKHHLWVLWTDYFKPEHLEKFPQLHDLVWKATKAAGETKHHSDVATAKALLDAVDEVGKVFAESKPGYDYDSVIKNTNLQIGL
jgi:nickel superoxide dismutase